MTTATPWTLTTSGRRVTPLAMTEDQIHWPDIAGSLAKINRFNGCTTTPYSVAQHCCHVARILPPELRLHGLLHDAHEAYIGDVTRPVKAILQRMQSSDAPIEVLSRLLDGTIYTKAGLAWPLSEPVARAIARADDAMLVAEIAQLFPDTRESRQAIREIGCDPAPVAIRPMTWTDAADWFESDLKLYMTQHTARAA